MRPTTRLWLGIAALFLCGAIAGCAGDEETAVPVVADSIATETPDGSEGTDTDDPDAGATDPGSGAEPDSTQTNPLRRGRLQAFTACDAFLEHMKSTAGDRVTAWGLEGGNFFGPIAMEGEFFPEEEAMALDSAADALESTAGRSAPAPQAEAVTTTSQDSGADDGGGVGFSETNNQVRGVDEPDFVKTDGSRIVVLTDQRLRTYRIDDGTATLDSELQLSVWPRDILLFDDRVLVIADDWGPVSVEPFDAEAGLVEDAAIRGNGPVTVAVQIDISDGAREVSTMRMEGQYISARRIGSTVRLVVSSPPPELSFIFPSGPGSEEIAADTNRRIIEDSQLSDWLSEYGVMVDGQMVEDGPISPCNRIYRPEEFSGFGVLSVLTFDLLAERLTSGNGTAVVTQGQSIYASDQSLYVATSIVPEFDAEQSFRTDENFENNFSTALHRFDISDPTAANYVASGSAPGTMLNQFSMHEWDNRLFVATTEGSPWGFSENSVSGITVLEPAGDELVEVGSVSDMGRGERIFSARFVEDTAYVVTFRQVDPLYVVDLSDPTAPQVRGELKIPGFSTYLHPIGNGRLIGIGQDATDEGRTQGLKLSLFDVSDPSDPREQVVWTLPDGYSPAEYDHRAFLWWEEQDLAVLPASSWRSGFSGAVLLNITPDGITEVGRLDHARDEVDGEDPSTCAAVEVPVESFGPDVTASVCDSSDIPPDARSCEVLSADEFRSGFNIELGLEDVELAEDEIFYLCFPEGGGLAPEIRRSLIIGDSLWTISWEHLQANDLDDLDRTERIGLY